MLHGAIAGSEERTPFHGVEFAVMSVFPVRDVRQFFKSVEEALAGSLKIHPKSPVDIRIMYMGFSEFP